MRTILYAGLAAACLIAAGCSGMRTADKAAQPTSGRNLSIAPSQPANLYFCFPGNPQWQYVGPADPQPNGNWRGKATTPGGAPLGRTLDFDVTTASVIYLRMDTGVTLGEITPATATGTHYAVATRLTAGRQYRLDWQPSSDRKTARAVLTDLASRVAIEAVAVKTHVCR